MDNYGEKSGSDIQRPQFGELDEDLAKLQQTPFASSAEGTGAQRRNKLQQLDMGVDGSKTVSAGRQIGFELLGYALFSTLLGFFMGFFGVFVVPEYFEHGSYLLQKFVLSGDVDFAVDYLGHQLPYNLVNAAITTFLLTILLVASGRTPGGLLGGYRMVDARNGKPVGFSKALAYYAVFRTPIK